MFIKNISVHGKKTVLGEVVLLDNLPEVLDDLGGLFPDSVYRADVVLDYSGHPDVPYALKNARRVITTSKCDLPNTVSVDCFCGTDITEEFGVPGFKVTVRDGRIEEIDVVKSSPCGAAYHLSEELGGLPVEEAVSKSGLMTQFFCKGRGGPEGSLHKAARIHKAALERAISTRR